MQPTLHLVLFLDSLTNSSITPYGDITEVSYLSDGKFFNTTLWVSDFINFTKPLFAEGIDILQLPNDENMTLYELANEYVKFKVGSFDIINPIFLTKNPKNITLDKEQGFNFEVMTTRNDSSRTEEIYSWTIVEHNNKIYDFVFSSLSHRYDDLLDDVKKVMNSFKFTDNSIHSNLENDSSFHINNKLNVAFIVPPNSDIDDYGHLIRINFPPPDYKLISKSYQILMDVKSTFDNGIDYIKKIWFDNSTQKWKETFYETKILKEIQENNKYENDGNLRIIEENEFTKFPTILLNTLDRQNFYVPISIDLNKINFPATYDIYFVTTSLYKTKDNLCNIIDATSFTPIPPPKINIRLIPESLEIRPGGRKKS